MLFIPETQLPWIALVHAAPLSLDELGRLAQACQRTLTPLAAATRPPRARQDRKRLRIGYIGAEADAWRLQVMASHAADRTEVVLFNASGLDASLESPSTVRVVPLDRNDPEGSFEAIASADLDALVDCAAFSDPLIPRLLARRPAPRVLAWGYPAPTGTLHDLHLFDRVTASPHMQGHFATPIHFLPSADLPCPVPDRFEASLRSRRDALGLATGAAVLVNCCRNAFAVISMLPRWQAILAAHPAATLWLPGLDAQGRREVVRAHAALDCPPSSLQFSTLASHDDLLAADLYLDGEIPDPDFGLRTALEIGLPAITCMGTTPAGRRSAGVLSGVGLGELVAQDWGHYTRLATRLIQTPAWRSALVKRLRRGPEHLSRRAAQTALAIEEHCRPAPAPPAASVTPDELFLEAFNTFGTRPESESLTLLDRAFATGCDRPDAWNLYGALLRKAGNADAAVFAFREAVERRPDFSDGWMNLGNAYRDLLRIDEAVTAYRRATELRPDVAVAFLNLGSCLNAHGAPAEALENIDKGLALDPENADLHWDRALALLMLGKTREAWPEYEWRHRRLQPPKRNYPQPEWTGQPLSGQRLLVYWEQGYGDTLQFLRFIPRLARKGAHVILHVQPGLGGLLESYPGVAHIVDGDDALPEFDYHVALLSLAHRFDISPDELLPAPDLVPPAALREAWAPRISARGRPRIGIVWAGNPNVKNDRIRSPRLEPLLSLFESTDCDWYVLQKGDGRRDLEDWQLPANVFDIAADIESFADTGAIMAALDLVISSDTSTAHLALALGRPTWVLLHHGSDWRWGLGERSIWYPGARLFRQTLLDDWDEVVCKVQDALAREFPTEGGTPAPAPHIERVARRPAEQPMTADTLFRQAIAHVQANDLESALRDTRLGLEADPRRADGWNMLGVINKRSGRFEEAREAYLEATRLNTRFADAWQNLGNLYRTWGRNDEAESAFLKAVDVSPEQAPSWSQLSDLYRAGGKLDRAVECARKATQLAPDLAEGWNHLGNAFNDQEEFAAAGPAYQQALRANPALHEARYNLGVAYQRQQKLDEAVACYRDTLKARPDDARAHYNLGTSFMAMGRLHDGFAEYEWRFKRGDDLKRRTYPQPEWRGEPIDGRSLLVYAEQGYGDSLQFLRFVPLLQHTGCRVVLEVQTGLRPLAQSLPGVQHVVETGEHLPDFDLHAPLLSLPFLLGVGDDDLPATLPYLGVPQEHLRHWAHRLPQNGRLRVGLIWAGNPKVGNDRVRSPRLRPLLPLFELDGIDWIVLQQGDGRRDLEGGELPSHVHDVANEIAAFVDSAAVMCHLDLVISSDTSTAHLAPAVGTPTWVLLHHSADWRWGTGADTPWYPGSRLFRQPAAGDWRMPVRMIAAALQAMIAERQTASAGS